MKVYNVAINPELAEMSFGTLRLLPTAHAKQRAWEKGVDLPLIMVVGKGSIVELEALGKTVKKLVVRFQTEGTHDNVYVLYHQFGNLWSILTVWQNHRDDCHSTLKMAKRA